ncbi:MAG TPA: type II secretion system protein, partial [Candidatus Paceibacterota bacterium]|nr:type II secretion system protein [Candidatus Paceibacterota bacterium]
MQSIFSEIRSSQLPLRGFNRDSFTLIELLVVVSIISILAVFLLITLNPSEMLKQSRDSQRLSDL